MTVIELKKQDGQIDITIKGHADYGKPDIVCSAVSVLTYTLAASIEKAICRLNAGDAEIHIDQASPEDETVVRTIMRGFRMLAEEYPRNVKVVENE